MPRRRPPRPPSGMAFDMEKREEHRPRGAETVRIARGSAPIGRDGKTT